VPLEILLAAEAIVGLPLLEKKLGFLSVETSPLSLSIRTIATTDVKTFIPLES
jgi:hypothetical protein